MVERGGPIKRNLVFVLLAGLWLLGCRPESTWKAATRTIRETFRLDKTDRVRIVGLADETDVIKSVKFQINGVPLVSRLVRYHGGWQLEDIGGPETLLRESMAPKFDPAEKYAIARREILTIAAALAGYGRSNREFEFRDAGFLQEGSDVYNALRPHFAIDLPTQDPWGYPYSLYYGKALRGPYRIQARSKLDYVVFSMGRDGRREGWAFDPEKPDAGLEEKWNPDHDIVFFNGRWIRGAPLSAGTDGSDSARSIPRSIQEFSFFKNAATEGTAGK